MSEQTGQRGGEKGAASGRRCSPSCRPESQLARAEDSERARHRHGPSRVHTAPSPPATLDERCAEKEEKTREGHLLSSASSWRLCSWRALDPVSRTSDLVPPCPDC